jgi:hypothetical protein
MRKLIGITIAVVMLLSLAVPALAAPKGVDFNGAHFELNLLGKKADWNGGGAYDNPDRHTMFVPESTEGWNIVLDQPNKVFQGGTQTSENLTSLPGLAVWMTQGDEFAVLDGTAFDDDHDLNFQLGPGKYAVYVVARAKPVENPAQIDGWIQVLNPFDNNYYYYLNVGTVSVSRKWQNATDLFMVSSAEVGASGLLAPVDGNEWVFDYLDRLDAAGYSDTAYFWQLQNNSRLLKVRFYKIG